MISILSAVFKQPRYVLIATFTSVTMFLLAVWLPNISLIAAVISSENGTLPEKAAFLLSLIGSIATNFSVLSAVATVLIATLFGMNIALLTHYIRAKREGSIGIRTLSGASAAGLVSGFLGIGCAACGTFILSSLLLLIGTGGILTFLPFGGEEFSIIGIGLLLYGLYSITKKTAEPNVCTSRYNQCPSEHCTDRSKPYNN